jgi:hypothetical protein
LKTLFTQSQNTSKPFISQTFFKLKNNFTMSRNTYFAILIAILACFQTVQAQSRIMAKQYTQESAETIMRRISPNTGKDATALIYDIEWDADAECYIIDMEASWKAGGCYFCSEQTFVVRGVLKVGRNGTNPTFRETYKNEAVRSAWSDRQIGAVFVGITVLAAASSSSSSNH